MHMAIFALMRPERSHEINRRSDVGQVSGNQDTGGANRTAVLLGAWLRNSTKDVIPSLV
jgi:hypothetical protein